MTTIPVALIATGIILWILSMMIAITLESWDQIPLDTINKLLTIGAIICAVIVSSGFLVAVWV